MVQQPLAGRRAVVIGGGMAGLMAARVLADHYAEVTIIERDALPDSAEPRKGVPQGRHAHALLVRGHQILEELLPGLTDDLVAHGALRGYARMFSGDGYHRPIRQGPGALLATRPLIEARVRAHVTALPNVGVVDRRGVRGIVANADRNRVTGVRVQRSGDDPNEEVLPADLVVDASGRGSQAPAWLKALGYQEPEEELVEVGMGYSSRFYRRDPRDLGGDLIVNVAGSPKNMRGCGMAAQEGDRWMVTLGGYFGDYPPTDEAGFLEFVRSLPVPEVYEVIRASTPLSDPVAFKVPANRRRRYENLKSFPEGFLVVGDGICSFTPIYGQGMTVAAMEAVALRDCLKAGTHRLARRFFKQAGKAIDVAWTITVVNDARLSGKPGARGPVERCLDRYMDRLHIAARHDTEVAAAFLRVANLLDAPAALLHPRIALRVLRANLRRPTTAPADAPAIDLVPVEG
jgi:2-polyprenyl-6-methoxyphenol hydroxylase-like FAD-dependent oxidoreductase